MLYIGDLTMVKNSVMKCSNSMSLVFKNCLKNLSLVPWANPPPNALGGGGIAVPPFPKKLP